MRRAKVLGFAAVVMTSLGLSSVVVFALRPTAPSLLVWGSVFILSGTSNAILGFGNRIDTDEIGVMGRRGRRYRRPKIRWTEVQEFKRVGHGSLLHPANVVARTRDGRAVALLSYSIDREAADEAVASLNRQWRHFEKADQAPQPGPIG